MTDLSTDDPRDEGFVAMIPHYWGWGATIPEAVARLRKACHGRESVAKGKRLVVQMPVGSTDVWVDDFGAIRWTWAEGADTTAQTATVESPK
jgi:hypothetical protein